MKMYYDLNGAILKTGDKLYFKNIRSIYYNIIELGDGGCIVKNSVDNKLHHYEYNTMCTRFMVCARAISKPEYLK